MDIEAKNLFTEGMPSNRGAQLGQWQVKRGNETLTIGLFEQTLVESNQMNKLRSIEFDFDLKFSF